ncbi:MAG: hypothetical protein GY711_34790 [bacterium]|nr:hypothetical protein [bacterium]
MWSPTLVAALTFSLAGASPRVQEPAALDAATRREVVEATAGLMRDRYVFKEPAQEHARALLAKLESGDYDALTAHAALAARLQADLRAATDDKHVSVRWTPPSERGGNRAHYQRLACSQAREGTCGGRSRNRAGASGFSLIRPPAARANLVE